MKPYLLLKPYFQNHLGTFSEGVKKYDLTIDSVFRVNNWKELSLVIYKNTVEKEGKKFEIGLYGHLELISYFFGNKAILVTFTDGNGKDIREKTYQKVLELKKYIRTTLKGGPYSNDILVCMNLDKIKIPKSDLLQTRGKLGVSLNNGGFTALSSEPGLWDYYYFKYVHTPDTYKECIEEFRKISQLGIFREKNKIPIETFDKMIKLKTYISPHNFDNYLL